MQTLKLFVWDWNGTLLNDNAAVHAATNEHIRVAGGDEVSLEEMLEKKQIPFESFYINRGCCPVLIQNTTVFYDAYNRHASSASLHLHVEQILAMLQRRGTRSVILTNMVREYVEHHLDRLAIRHYFDAFSYNDAGNQVLYGSVKGRRLAQLINGVPPSEVCLVGDTVEEIEIARSYGCTSIAISAGAHPRHRLAAAKPTHLFDSYEPLLALLQ